jgi:putative tricarboxylic transport membrane protein
LIAEQGNIFAFVERPLSATFIGLAILFFVMPFVVAFITGAKERLHVPSKRPKIN